jgi:methylmalonyl-CoA/ethylmalonyl-CoA epimerase
MQSIGEHRVHHGAVAGATLHHIGLALRSVDKSVNRIGELFGADWSGRVTHDPLQRVNVTFLKAVSLLTLSIELVEPCGDESPVASHLQKQSNALHHVCLEVDSMTDALYHAQASGALLVKPPLPACAFGGRSIAWVYTPDRLLVEYLER